MKMQKNTFSKEKILTVVVPSYNHEKYILQTIRELVKIKKIKKILVIDDKSVDNTVNIVRSFIKQNPFYNIEIIEKAKNKGLVSSLNLGLKLTDTDFIYFIASDDIPIPHNIDYLVEYMRKKKHLKFVIGGALNYFEDKHIEIPTYGKKHYKFFSVDFQKRKEKLFLDYPHPLLIQSTIFRTEALKAIGGWDENIALDDYPIFVKLFSEFGNFGVDFEFRPDIIVVKYRHHLENSYKRILYQYNLVKEALMHLAPHYLLDKAIGYSLAYYILLSIKKGDFKAFTNLIREVSLKNFPYVVYKSIKLIIEKLSNYLR